MREKKEHKRNRIGCGKRYPLIDSIRGLALISMIFYHGVWNMVYLYGMDWLWYRGREAFYWQQSICRTFIFLSGFCWSMGKRQLRNGILVFGSGALVSIVTFLFMPQNRIIFGVLTCIGSCILLTVLFRGELSRVSPVGGLGISLFLFSLTDRINEGELGIFHWSVNIREIWYQQTGIKGWITTWLGFPTVGFYSTDYFSLFPWFFLFLTGYFAYRLAKRRGWLCWKFWQVKIPGAEVLGRNSLLVYLLHQPVLYLLGSLVFPQG